LPVFFETETSMGEGHGVVLVVLPSGGTFRAELCRALPCRGYEALAAPAWRAALTLGEGRPLAAVVFDTGQPPLRGIDWRRGLGRFRDGHPGVAAISLGQAPTIEATQSGTTKGEKRARLAVIFVGFGDPGAIAARVVAAIQEARRRAKVAEDFNALHARLLAGDAGALDHISALMAPEVERALRQMRCLRKAPDEVIASAVGKALAQLVAAPERYDPTRGHPDRWLAAVAKHDAIDAWRKAKQVQAHEVLAGDEAAQHIATPPEASPEALLLEAEAKMQRRRKLLELTDTSADRAGILAYLEDDPPAVVAATLGYADALPGVQRASIRALEQKLRKRHERREAGRAPLRTASRDRGRLFR
jgi:DNA-directed RNA polymerase specialized sigma24 family protein